MSGLLKNGLLFGAGAVVAFVLFLALTGFGTASAQKSGQSQQVYSQGGSAGGGGSAGTLVSRVVYENYGYAFYPGEFRKGERVRLEFDMKSLYGCMRSVVIPAFGIRKTLSESDNVIEFVPDKAGTFNIACSMNMGRGQFTVLESDGSASVFVEPQKVQAAGGGGCGCGSGSGSCGGA